MQFQQLELETREFLTIKKKQELNPSKKLTVNQLRSYQKNKIMEMVEKNQHYITHFNEIMNHAILDRDYPEFVALRTLGDFTDGFKVRKGKYTQQRSMRSFLQGFELDVLLPRPSNSNGYYFVQLLNGPFDIGHCLMNLLNAVSFVRTDQAALEDDRQEPFISQFDATRDLKGTFYCSNGAHQVKAKLKTALEDKLGIKLKHHGNTFNTCVQFIQEANDLDLYVRIKIYSKTTQLFQSSSTSMQLGMNTNALFAPTQRMLKALRETGLQGLSRIEISYYANN